VARKAECLTDGNEPLPSILRQHTTTESYSSHGQKKKGAYAPLLFVGLRYAGFSNSDRENSPLTSPSAVASLADIARLLKRVLPYGS